MGLEGRGKGCIASDSKSDEWWKVMLFIGVCWMMFFHFRVYRVLRTYLISFYSN